MVIVFILMGVSGCGKSTIGKMLANQLKCDFVDADDHHSESSIDKMKNSIPLDDEDRQEWLKNLSAIIQSYISNHSKLILACSALKRIYRKRLRGENIGVVAFIHLKGSFELIRQRLKQRKGHYMPDNLLTSQFETLEELTDEEKRDELNIDVNVNKTAEEIVSELLRHFTKRK